MAIMYLHVHLSTKKGRSVLRLFTKFACVLATLFTHQLRVLVLICVSEDHLCKKNHGGGMNLFSMSTIGCKIICRPHPVIWSHVYLALLWPSWPSHRTCIVLVNTGSSINALLLCLTAFIRPLPETFHKSSVRCRGIHLRVISPDKDAFAWYESMHHFVAAHNLNPPASSHNLWVVNRW